MASLEMIKAIGLLAMLPALLGLLLPDGPLAWYVADSALVVVLLIVIGKSVPWKQRMPILAGVVVHAAACLFGIAHEDSKAPSIVLWGVLVLFAITAEYVARVRQ